MNTQPIHTCRECGHSLKVDGKLPNAQRKFCSTKCRLAYNNRRRDRGAELFDMFMALRFEREDAKAANLWTLMCDRASAYRDADKYMRQGRKSWQDIEDVLEAIPPYRSANAGDNR